MILVEINYKTYDLELFIIIIAFKYKRYYFKSNKYKVTVIRNYNNLKYFITIKELNGR
jgi:RNase H-like domain found in reverse transcriptase